MPHRDSYILLYLIYVVYENRQKVSRGAQTQKSNPSYKGGKGGSVDSGNISSLHPGSVSGCDYECEKSSSSALKILCLFCMYKIFQ